MQPPAHFLAGAAVCRHVRWAPLGLALAFTSHFVLDALPHFEDPSILPRRLAATAGENWGLALWGTHIATVVLAALVWMRFATAWRKERRRIAYLIVGGLLACLPDYLGRIWDPGGVVGYLNTESHRWWFVPYIQAVRGHPEWQPTIAFACIAIELVVCGISGWLLLRGNGSAEANPANPASPDHGATEGQARDANGTPLPEGEQPTDRG